MFHQCCLSAPRCLDFEVHDSRPRRTLPFRGARPFKQHRVPGPEEPFPQGVRRLLQTFPAEIRKADM